MIPIMGRDDAHQWWVLGQEGDWYKAATRDLLERRIL
jgi:hypothetical protein